MYYRLGPDGRTPIPVRDTEPGDWFEAMRRVDFTKFGDDDQSFVSTLFLSTDHNFSGKGPPLVFETMIFRDGKWGEQWRCSTWEEAEAQHAEAVHIVRVETTPKSAIARLEDES